MHRALFSALRQAGRVLLTGPVSPDGDSVGACLALQRALAHHGKRVDVAGTPGFRYDWLPGASGMVPDDALTGDYDAVVVLDGDRHRLMPGAAQAFAAARLKAIIDHHASTTTEGYDLAWLDAGAASTCELLFDALPDWGVPLDEPLSSLLYTGLVFDTGGFRYSNTTPGTHRMAAALLGCGIDHVNITARVMFERRLPGLKLLARVTERSELACGGRLAMAAVTLADRDELALEDGDLEGLVDLLLHVQGVTASVLFIERAPGSFKLSLRSRSELDVAALAASLSPNGGGHAKAAGTTVHAALPETKAIAVAAFTEAFARL